MSKADEMFKKLGYIKTEGAWREDNKLQIVSYNGNETLIEFILDTKNVFIGSFLNIQELQAINEKCKELGWEE